MGPEFIIFTIVMIAVGFLGFYVKELGIEEDRHLFDKSKVKYFDGDNT